MTGIVMIENAVGLGLQTLGLGIGIVIAMLLLLSGLLYVLIPVFRKLGQKKSTNVPDKTAPVAAPALAASVTASDDDEETVAAIIAAIAASEGKAPEGFRVVSFKRI